MFGKGKLIQEDPIFKVSITDPSGKTTEFEVSNGAFVYELDHRFNLVMFDWPIMPKIKAIWLLGVELPRMMEARLSPILSKVFRMFRETVQKLIFTEQTKMTITYATHGHYGDDFRASWPDFVPERDLPRGPFMLRKHPNQYIGGLN